MAKKLGRIALFSAIAGATAAAVYYYLQKREAALADDFDDSDDFDSFDDDLDDDFPEDSADSANAATGKNHVHIPIDLESAKEIIGNKVIETIDKTKERLEQLNVVEKLDKAKEIISDRISPPAPAETEYTEMDMNSSSTAYADDAEDSPGENSLEEEQFFDDSDDESK